MYYKLLYRFGFIYHNYSHIPYTKFILFSYVSNLTAEPGLLIGFLSKAERIPLPVPLKTLDIYISRDSTWLLHSSTIHIIVQLSTLQWKNPTPKQNPQNWHHS